MTFTLPTWLLWTLGIIVGVPAILATLFLAWFGYQALKIFEGWR